MLFSSLNTKYANVCVEKPPFNKDCFWMFQESPLDFVMVLLLKDFVFLKIKLISFNQTLKCFFSDRIKPECKIFFHMRIFHVDVNCFPCTIFVCESNYGFCLATCVIFATFWILCQAHVFSFKSQQKINYEGKITYLHVCLYHLSLSLKTARLSPSLYCTN
jgi:hypothetical protein